MTRVIVVVEGPSAAGKTTWCERHAERFVPESAPTVGPPIDADADTEAAYWVAINSGRWNDALALEHDAGLAICDGDPFKLHYSWGLSMIGAAPKSRWERELKAARRAFEDDVLGFADLVLFSAPPVEQLTRQRSGDTSRRRGRFDLHVQLREPLIEWYRAIDSLDPGRVIWEFPRHGLPELPQPRPARSSPHLLDDLVAALPPTP